MVHLYLHPQKQPALLKKYSMARNIIGKTNPRLSCLWRFQRTILLGGNPEHMFQLFHTFLPAAYPQIPRSKIEISLKPPNPSKFCACFYWFKNQYRTVVISWLSSVRAFVVFHYFLHFRRQ